jgi:hypothetical protein
MVLLGTIIYDHEGDGLSRHANFETAFRSFSALFRMATGDAWGAMLADGHVAGDNLICSLHGWDYVIESGVSAYDNRDCLEKFDAWIDDDTLVVDAAQIREWEHRHPQPFDRDAYQGAYQDPHGAVEEPHTALIHRLAEDGLATYGHHGPLVSMGVSREDLPAWDSIQFVTAQLARRPKLDDDTVGTQLVIGPNAARPLTLNIPIFVSDMSYGALSEEAKTALATGAEAAGTGICSGEGGMLPEEQAANSRYFYELASAEFGWNWDVAEQVQAFHFKFGQGAKTGTGGHLPGDKVVKAFAAEGWGWGGAWSGGTLHVDVSMGSSSTNTRSHHSQPGNHSTDGALDRCSTRNGRSPTRPFNVHVHSLLTMM